MKRLLGVVLTVLLVVALGPTAEIAARGPARHRVRRGPLPQRIASRPLPRVFVPRSTSTLGPLAALSQNPRQMRVLVIAGDGSEPAFAALTTALDQIGISAQTFVAAGTELTAEFLATAGQANFYAVMLATSNLAVCDQSGCQSAFSDAEWQILRDFEAQYGIRQVTFYTFPTAEEGFVWSGTAGETPSTGTITTAGRAIFPYTTTTIQIPIRNAYTYFATTMADATPVITTSDGYALAATKTYADGRQNLAFTMDSNPFLLHTRLIAYGAINWAVKAIYLGQRRAFLAAQVDDLLISNDRYFGGEYRMSSSDFQAALNWQGIIRTHPVTAEFRIAYPFNGEGSTTPGDPLTAIVAANRQAHEWLNHTYTHANLDAATQAETEQEIRANTLVAKQLKLSPYRITNLITPDVSGLNNPAAMAGAAAKGVRQIVSDWSIPSQRNPTFNTGLLNAHQPTIYMIPRYPTNLFYNVTEPAEWLAEFMAIYPTFCTTFPTYCPGGSLTYDSLIDFESEVLLGYLLTFDLNPLMFHQANLREYVAGRSLLSDLIGAVLTKYEGFVTPRIRKLTMENIALEMQRRSAYNAAGAVGIWTPGQNVTITATTAGARIPVTGVRYGTGFENYGGQFTSYVTLTQGQSVVIPYTVSGGPPAPMAHRPSDLVRLTISGAGDRAPAPASATQGR